MRQKREKTTILFVNKNLQTLKPIQVSSTLLLNWKKYFAGLSLLLCSLSGTAVYFLVRNVKQSKPVELLSHRLQPVPAVLTEVDTSAMLKKFTNIEKKLLTIKGFLKARGIETDFKGPKGGEANHDVLTANESIDFYEGYLNHIIYNLSYTPLGLPYSGAVTSAFGYRENPFAGTGIETHKGLDIRGPAGAHVKAMAKGKVEFAGYRGGYGNCIILKHGNGFKTLYGHLSKILVIVGQQIEIGQQIGNIGSTGRSTGPHLHYEVHRNGKQVNPKPFLTLN